MYVGAINGRQDSQITVRVLRSEFSYSNTWIFPPSLASCRITVYAVEIYLAPGMVSELRTASRGQISSQEIFQTIPQSY